MKKCNQGRSISFKTLSRGSYRKFLGVSFIPSVLGLPVLLNGSDSLIVSLGVFYLLYWVSLQQSP